MFFGLRRQSRLLVRRPGPTFPAVAHFSQRKGPLFSLHPTCTLVGASSARLFCAAGTRVAPIGGARSFTTTPSASGEMTEKFRKDYATPPYWIREVQLSFDIHDDETIVKSKLFVERDLATPAGTPLDLHGEDLQLKEILVDGTALAEGQYTTTAEGLSLRAVPTAITSFVVQATVGIHPFANTRLQGMYGKGSLILTQCEAESFRRITYMLDRPDVMARYTSVRLEADKAKFPILLSNGNEVAREELSGGRHAVTWADPFPKPSYLFAAVAGDLRCIKDEYTTMRGRKVTLQLWSDPKNVPNLYYAMDCLKKAMKWDEDTFGLEYDLDLFNIVATRDFNMGAMENKGLNVFRASLIQANPDTSTDDDYERILGIIGHEYFHNWTGNRVTCRDWFQLTLKEGLTVFRDQSFSADVLKSPIRRIEVVRALRSSQFTEDAGPLAHPIRPESYFVMENFYTQTVYNKGAEICRMYQTLLGKQGFRKGMDLYFQRHDGKAVTCDDFRSAMADANKVDLTQFENWYSTSGTPTVEAEGKYDPTTKRYTLTLKQSVAPTPKQPVKPLLHIPVVAGLISKRNGSELAPSRLLELKEKEQSFVFEGISEEPIPSVLRDYSAPVVLKLSQTDEELAFLMANDTDTFNRWECGQRLTTRVWIQIMEALHAGKPESELELPPAYLNAVRKIVEDTTMEPSFKAYALSLPLMSALMVQLPSPLDFDSFYRAREFIMRSVAAALLPGFVAIFHSLAPKDQGFVADPTSIARRRLRGQALAYICKSGDPSAASLCAQLYHSATCATERQQALSSLSGLPGPEFDQLLEHYRESAKGDPAIIDKWFRVQALADSTSAVQRVRSLLKHPDFDLKDPTRLTSLVFGFLANLPQFHSRDGSGYALLGDVLLDLDKINPQMAAYACDKFSNFRKFTEERQALMRAQLERIRDHPGLSANSMEMVTRSLA